MQHVYGHTGNLGNECADHAAAQGTFGLLSNHNLSTRWARHNFDTCACCGDVNSISEVLENCVALELIQHRYLRTGVSALFLIGFSMAFAPCCTLVNHGKPIFVYFYHFEFWG